MTSPGRRYIGPAALSIELVRLPSGVDAQLAVPRGVTWGPTTRAVVYAHSGNGAWRAFSDGPSTGGFAGAIELNQRRALSALCQLTGLPMISPNAGALSWGSPAAVAIYQEARAHLVARGCRPRVGLLGVSMGATSAARSIQAAPTLWSGAVTLLGAFDLDFHRGTDLAPGVYYDSINAAHGVTTDDAWNQIRDDRSPVRFASTLSPACPWWEFHQENDTTAPLTYAARFVAAHDAASLSLIGGAPHVLDWLDQPVNRGSVAAALDRLAWN